MAETLVENRVCNACGADVRSNALFCYNCGSSVAPDIVVALKDKENVAGKSFRENGNSLKPDDQSVVAEVIDKPIPKPDLPEETNLKSAAAMRRKSKSFQPKRIEVIWEEHENPPNGWFILVAIVLTLFAAGILYLTMTLK